MHSHKCPPPPPTLWHRHMHNTTHGTRCEGGGEGGPRGRTQAPHKHPLSVKLSAPPPLSMFWSGLWGPCLFCLRLGRVSISSLQVCWFFFYCNVDVKKWVHSDTKRYVCYSFPPPCHVHVCDRVSVVWGCLVHCCSVMSCAVRVSGMLCPPSSQFMQPPPPCVHWCLACWLVGCWFSGCLVGCYFGCLVVG